LFFADARWKDQTASGKLRVIDNHDHQMLKAPGEHPGALCLYTETAELEDPNRKGQIRNKDKASSSKSYEITWAQPQDVHAGTGIEGSIILGWCDAMTPLSGTAVAFLRRSCL
jgi:hypothetical protein